MKRFFLFLCISYAPFMLPCCSKVQTLEELQQTKTNRMWETLQDRDLKTFKKLFKNQPVPLLSARQNLRPLVLVAADKEFAEYFLKHADDFNLQQDDYSAALLRVVTHETYEALALAKQYLASGADINICNEHSYTPLMLAVMFGNPCMLALLLNENANTALKSDEGKTAKQYINWDGLQAHNLWQAFEDHDNKKIADHKHEELKRILTGEEEKEQKTDGQESSIALS